METFHVEHPARVVIVATSPFSVMCVARIIGPPMATWRRFQFDTMEGDGEYQIDCKGRWQLESHELKPQEELDPTPMEIPLGGAPSLRDEVKQYIMEELYRQREEQEDFDTPAEADDFEVPDEEELVSPYEMVEMDSEYPLENQDVKDDNVSTVDAQETEDGVSDREQSGKGEQQTQASIGAEREGASGDVQRDGDDAGRKRHAERATG